MNKAINIELQFFLISILWGAILLFVYDGLRILRRLVKHNSIILAIEDLLFWVAASVFIFAMMYRKNYGIIRGFSVMGMAIGMILYHYILSELYVNVASKVIFTLFRPVMFVFHSAKRMLRSIIAEGKMIFKFLLLQLKKLIKSVRIAMDKRKKKRVIKKEIRRDKKARKVSIAKKSSNDLKDRS